MSRYRFIAAEKANYPVALLCRVLQVLLSGSYAWRHRGPSRRSQANVQLTKQIRAIYERSRGTYGAPHIRAELHADKPVFRKRAARLMRAAGLDGRPPRSFRRTTTPDPNVELDDLVQRDFTASGPDQKWIGDIIYIRTWEDWLYLAVILDAYSRKVVWAMAEAQPRHAGAATRRMGARPWGAILNALPHPVQIVVRARPTTRLPTLEEARAGRTAEQARARPIPAAGTTRGITCRPPRRPQLLGLLEPASRSR